MKSEFRGAAEFLGEQEDPLLPVRNLADLDSSQAKSNELLAEVRELISRVPENDSRRLVLRDVERDLLETVRILRGVRPEFERRAAVASAEAHA